MSLGSLELALNPLTAPELLRELASHEDIEVRQGVVSNPNTPSEALFKLALEFPGEFFNNPVFPLLSLENPDFYKTIPENTLRNLLVHESVPDSWLKWASYQTGNRLVYSVVANPVTSRAVLEKIYEYERSMREEVQMHVNYALEMTDCWHKCFKDKFKPWEIQRYRAREEMLLLWELGIIQKSQFLQLPNKVKLTILKQTKSPQLIETILANKPIKPLRLACAANLFTPADYLIKLSYDNDNQVRESAMRNPNIPREVVEEYYRQHLTANHPNSQPHELSELLSSKWWSIRASAAKHPNLSLDDLEKCLFDADLNVRASTAKNPNISIEALEKLTQDKSSLVRSRVAQHLKTPIHCLEKLSSDSNEEVRASVIFNSNISAELSASIKAKLSAWGLEKYSEFKLNNKSENSIRLNSATSLSKLITSYRETRSNSEINSEAIKYICQQLILNQDISAELLGEIISILPRYSENKNIHTAIACHKNINQEVYYKLIQYSNTETLYNIAHNPNIYIELLESFLQKRADDVRLSALQAYQKRYANSNNTSNFIIEWGTATHPNTPPEKLIELVNSEWILVREAIAMHPRAAEAFIVTSEKTATTILEILAKDKCQSVRIAVAENPNTSIEILEAIIKAQEYNSKTCQVALKHLIERAPDRAEKHLLHYYNQIDIDDVELRPLILQHPAAPIDLLKNKLRLLSWMERYTITQNPKTSQEILEILAKDANRVVRAAAKERLRDI